MAGVLLGGPWVVLAGGSKQLERVLPHLTHWGGAVEEARELFRDLPVLPLHRVLAPAAAAPPVVLEWTKRNKKLNVVRINRVLMQRVMAEQSSQQRGRARLGRLRGGREQKRGGRKTVSYCSCSICTQSQSIYEIPNTGLINAAWQPSSC